MATSRPALDENELRLLTSSRRAVMATIAADGRPRLVPIAYAFVDPAVGPLVLYSALDEKPKSVADPRDLARVRDILARPRVSLLVDAWSEEWSELAWLRLDGAATVLEPEEDRAGEHMTAIGLLRERYPQYATHRLEERPVIRIEVEDVVSWNGGA